MSTLTGKDLNLVKPALTDDYKVTIGTDLPANFQKIDDEFSAHLADLVTDIDGVHGLKVESGVWTPYVYGTTNEGNNSYTRQIGKYIKTGKQVVAIFYCELSSKDTLMEGNVRIGGLPFATESMNFIQPGVTISRCSDLITGGKQLVMSCSDNSTNIILTLINDGAYFSSVPSTNIKNTTILAGSVSYTTQ